MRQLVLQQYAKELSQEANTQPANYPLSTTMRQNVSRKPKGLRTWKDLRSQPKQGIQHPTQ